MNAKLAKKLRRQMREQMGAEVHDMENRHYEQDRNGSVVGRKFSGRRLYKRAKRIINQRSGA